MLTKLADNVLQLRSAAMIVSKTQIRQCPASSRHRIGFAPTLLAILAIAVTVAVPVMANPQKKSWQSVSSIEAAALKYIEGRQAASSGRTEFRVKTLDRRLKLARCGAQLETFAPSNVNPGTTQVVGVRCSKPHPWKIYVPISTTTYEQVVVTTRPLQRGASINPGDVRLEERDISKARHRYLTELKQLDGRVLRQDIRAQTIISQNVLDAEDIVKRGQSVTLLARTGRMNVRMRGEALSSAAKDQRIRVKNLSSQRVVEGIVQSRQLVLVDH